mmetsp:Transcript_27935/g.70884  ORF Transcript_27935/g.70884 Transcript_27935/m.70884 type:complete len:357 (+) Transcript_27935:672-1742(+)
MSLKDLKPCSSTRDRAVQSCPRTSTAISLFFWSLPKVSTDFVDPAALAWAKCFSMALTADRSTGSASLASGILAGLLAGAWPEGRLLVVAGAAAGAAAVVGCCVMPSSSRKDKALVAPATELDWRRAAREEPAAGVGRLATALPLARARLAASAGSVRPLGSGRSSSFFSSATTCSFSWDTCSARALFSASSLQNRASSWSGMTTSPPPPGALALAAAEDAIPSFCGRDLLAYLAMLCEVGFAPVLLRAICFIRSTSSDARAFASSSAAFRRASSSALRLARISASLPPCCLRTMWPRTTRCAMNTAHFVLCMRFSCTAIRAFCCRRTAALRRRISLARLSESIGRLAMRLRKNAA